MKRCRRQIWMSAPITDVLIFDSSPRVIRPCPSQAHTGNLAAWAWVTGTGDHVGSRNGSRRGTNPYGLFPLIVPRQQVARFPALCLVPHWSFQRYGTLFQTPGANPGNLPQYHDGVRYILHARVYVLAERLCMNSLKDGAFRQTGSDIFGLV
jgi:hypothetical protein